MLLSTEHVTDRHRSGIETHLVVNRGEEVRETDVPRAAYGKGCFTNVSDVRLPAEVQGAQVAFPDRSIRASIARLRRDAHVSSV